MKSQFEEKLLKHVGQLLHLLYSFNRMMPMMMKRKRRRKRRGERFKIVSLNLTIVVSNIDATDNSSCGNIGVVHLYQNLLPKQLLMFPPTTTEQQVAKMHNLQLLVGSF